MHLYVSEQGARLCKSGTHLVVSKGLETLDDVLLDDVESVALFGSVQMTTEALNALQERGTDISFLSRGGHFRGRVVSGVSKNVYLRLRQYEAFRDLNRSFGLARGTVLRKLENGLLVLDAFNYNSHNDFSFEERDEYVKNLNRVRELAVPDRDALRGYEGYGAKLYFQAFARCLKQGVNFPGRVYYPSTDPVNALLSFGYSLVARNLEGLLEACGLDPSIGFFHELNYGRASLSLDLMEEFRHPLVDRMVLTLFNKRIIAEDDFELRLDENKPGQLYLKRDAMRIFVRHYEETLETPCKLVKEFPNLTWRGLLKLRVENYRKALLEESDLVPFDYCSSLGAIA